MRTHLLLALSLLTAAPALAQRRPAAAQRRPAPARAPAAADTSPTRALETPGFALRPIDRATVRIIAIGGLSGRFARGRSGSLRLLASPHASYGSGVVVSADGVVLTARHVIEGADLLAVVFAGQRVAVAARPLYSDPDNDIAFLTLQTSRPLTDVAPLPTAAPSLTSGQRVLASGYPLDPEERYPAAVAGEFARLNNDGRIQLSISVNHGNSGGPVVDEAGRLLGVVSMRGEPERGVEGLSLVEPIRTVIEPWTREVRALPRPAFGPDDARIAQAAYDLLRLDPDHDARDPASAERALALANASLSPEASAILGAQAWNEAIILLESQRVADVAALSAELRPRAEALVRAATDLQLRALRAAPYLRTNYSFLYWFSRIRASVVAPPPAPVREREDDAGERVGVDPEARQPQGQGAAAAVASSPGEAKVVTFLERQLRLPSPATASAGGQVTVQVRLNASGVVQAASLVQGTGDAAYDNDVTTRLRALAERHPRVESLTASELSALADRDLRLSLQVRRR